MSELLWMFCTQCRQTVIRNDCGICLACQRKYTPDAQPDSWINIHRCIKCGKRSTVENDICRDCDSSGRARAHDKVFEIEDLTE